jgi:hypothetical protein
MRPSDAVQKKWFPKNFRGKFERATKCGVRQNSKQDGVIHPRSRG